MFFLHSLLIHPFPGRRLDHVFVNADGIRGFPGVLQQISKILNYPLVSAGQIKSGELLNYLFFNLLNSEHWVSIRPDFFFLVCSP